jgi:asparagine synthase (glutamine-hydrolysing)
LAELAPELAKIPYQRTGVAPTMPILAHRIGFLAKGSYKFLARKLRAKTHGFISLPHKIGYPDLDDWIRHDKNLRQFLESILLDRKTLARGYFNPDFVTQMVKDHVKGKKDWGMQLCALLTFELWNRLFIDESMEARIDYTR